MNKNFFQCDFKEVEIKEGSIKIKGFASTPDIDRYNDIVDPKAFNLAINSYMNNPVVLLQHNNEKPIGKTINYTLTRRGLEIKAELTNNIENLFDLVKDGVLKGFSIGYIPKKWEIKQIDQNEIRVITELDLVEVSVVSVPANPNSLFTLTKSIKNFFDKELIDNIKNMEPKEIGDGVGKSSENLDTIPENINTETIENIEEVEVKESIKNENQNNEEVKTLKEVFETQKIEIEELKSSLNSQNDLLNSLIDNMIELSKRTNENKSALDNLPIKKGLATLGVEKKAVDPLFNELMNAKNKF